jgi:hypothetical protein
MKDNEHTSEGQRPRISLPGKAAIYVRMPADYPDYSTENQAMAIDRYAKQRRINIVAHYTDGAAA